MWSRVFATFYDPTLWLGEVAGMRRRRAELLAQARGRTLELGAGTGLNLPHYPDVELILLEPDPAMRARLARRAAAAELLDAGAEAIPLEDDSVDTVVATLVLCTVDDPAATLDEIARVLRPDGQLLLIEHVRAHQTRLARWQDRLEAPWRHFAVGCRCNRSTGELLRAAGFELDVREASWRAMPPIIAPLIAGRAYPTTR
jgi:ubiquinone/menaquinone biosynthesis C-methylase UbiE